MDDEPEYCKFVCDSCGTNLPEGTELYDGDDILCEYCYEDITDAVGFDICEDEEIGDING